jgi:cell division ATPase FtsA
VELAERVLGIPARIGGPRSIAGLPEAEARAAHASALGILEYAAELSRARGAGSRGILGFFRRPIREWVRDYL